MSQSRFSSLAAGFALSFTLIASGAQTAHACAGDPNPYFTIKSVRQIRPPGKGGRVDWSRALDLIAYDRKDDHGINQVYVMKPDGSDDRCITCGRPEVPQFVNGQPAWHPSGKYLVFQSANLGSSNPGAGVNAELWVYSLEEDQFTRLTYLETYSVKGQYGVLHPHFSNSGTQLAWSEMYEGLNRGAHGEIGYWKLKVAEFAIGNSGPFLGPDTAYEPGGPAFYENHGFLPNDEGLIFSSNYESPILINRIYRFNFNREILSQLTYRNYNEHAEFSLDGSYIAWMTNADIATRGTDLWGMGPWGGGKARITFFNDPNCTAEFMGPYVVVADHSFGPGGKKIVLYLQHNLAWNVGGKDEGEIVVIEAY